MNTPSPATRVRQGKRPTRCLLARALEDAPSHFFVIAGPNGRAVHLAPERLRDCGRTEYVNADLIAKGLSAFDTESVAFRADG